MDYERTMMTYLATHAKVLTALGSAITTSLFLFTSTSLCLFEGVQLFSITDCYSSAVWSNCSITFHIEYHLLFLVFFWYHFCPADDAPMLPLDYSVPRFDNSHMCPDHPRRATPTKVVMWRGVPDVVNHAKFHQNWLRGRNPPFSYA